MNLSSFLALLLVVLYFFVGVASNEDDFDDEADAIDSVFGGQGELVVKAGNTLAHDNFRCSCLTPFASFDDVVDIESAEALEMLNSTVWATRRPLFTQVRSTTAGLFAPIDCKLCRLMCFQWFANPNGDEFELVAVARARNVRPVPRQRPVSEATWFAGYAWVPLQCASCGAHVGWLFTRIDESSPSLPAFAALSLDHIVVYDEIVELTEPE